jgi:hypothetical protein
MRKGRKTNNPLHQKAYDPIEKDQVIAELNKRIRRHRICRRMRVAQTVWKD